MWSFRMIRPRRNSRRRLREAVSAAAQPLEIRQFLSAASLSAVSLPSVSLPSVSLSEYAPTGWSPTNSAPTTDALSLRQYRETSRVESHAVLPLNSDLIFRDDFSAVEDGAPPEPPETLLVAAVTKSAGTPGRNVLRLARAVHSATLADQNQDSHSALPALDLAAGMTLPGAQSLSGRESLTATLDRLASRLRPSLDPVGVPVHPGKFEDPFCDVPAPDGGLIDVTPLFQPGSSAAENTLIEFGREQAPADVDNQPEAFGDTPDHQMLDTYPLDSFVPLPQAATVLAVAPHRATAAAEDGGYIDVVPLASAAIFHTGDAAGESPASGRTMPPPEIDGAVGRHRSFQMADSIEDSGDPEDAENTVEAVDACSRTNQLGFTLTRASADAKNEPGIPALSEPRSFQTVTSHSPEAVTGSGLTTEPSVQGNLRRTASASDVADIRTVDETSPTGRPTWLLVPALVTVGALRSGVRRRLRKIVAGLTRKI
ncbi:MAG: hypothetical protein RIK87_12505 [Fuerstiella sp.]